MNNSSLRIKNEIEILETAWKDFGQFRDVEATSYRRQEMAGLIKKYTEEKGIFKRVDKDKEIRLHFLDDSLGLSPELVIYKTTDNKFGVMDCRLVATLEGMHEQLQEIRVYEQEMKFM